MTAQAAHARAEEDARFETEVQLIGALLFYQTASAYHSAAAIVGPEHFSDNFNARVFSRIGKAVEAGLHGFPLVQWIIAEFRDDATLTELGRPMSFMVARYVANACPEIGIEGSARQIKHDYLAIELKLAVEDGNTASAEEIAAEMERLSKAHLHRDSNVLNVGRSAGSVIERLNTIHMDGEVKEKPVWPGSGSLAEVIGGFYPGRLYVFGGRPGSGKTTALSSLLLRTALKGHGVLFFQLEMNGDELTEMALCDLAWSSSHRIEYRSLRDGSPARPEFGYSLGQLIQASNRLRGMPYIICDKHGLSIADIRSQAAQAAQRLEAQGKKLDVICVDHMGLLKASSQYSGNKVAEMEEVSNGLKALAKELKCAVVCLAQLNRTVEGRENKRPDLSDLRWSGAIEQDADVVMFVYREAYYLSKPLDDQMLDMQRRERLKEVQNKLEIICAKNRQGPTPVLHMFCDMGCAVVRDQSLGEWRG